MGSPILVVDDKAGFRLLLTGVLEDAGYAVMTASDGPEALAILDRLDIRLIVTDVQMPGLDGLRYCRALADRGTPIPIVVMTSWNGEEIAREVGAVGYVDKPFTMYQARATIEAALQLSAADQADIVPVEQERAVRVFVLTSQRFLGAMIKLTLDHGVYVCRDAQTFDDALAILRDWRPNLAVIDLDSGGEAFLRHLRENERDGARRIPLLAVTRDNSLQTSLDAFALGVDDVLTVPISPELLLVRVLAVTRRTFGQDFPLRPVVKLGDVEINILNHQVRIGTTTSNLTETEQSLLYLLAANSGEVLTTPEILATIWGADEPSENGLVDQHVQSLRDKLQNGWTERQFIATVPGVGYRFDPVVSDLAAETPPVTASKTRSIPEGRPTLDGRVLATGPVS